MEMERFVRGEVVATLDVGTTATKAAIVHRDGSVLASCQKGYPTHTGPGGIVEQHPHHWWEAACDALHGCKPSRFSVAALVVSGQMQDLIVLGPRGRDSGTPIP